MYFMLNPEDTEQVGKFVLCTVIPRYTYFWLKYRTLRFITCIFVCLVFCNVLVITCICMYLSVICLFCVLNTYTKSCNLYTCRVVFATVRSIIKVLKTLRVALP